MASYKSFLSNELFSIKGKVSHLSSASSSPSDLGLQVAIVTGGGTGIGKGIAAALTLNGAKVFIVGRRFEVVKATAKELSDAAAEAQTDGECIPIEGDVATKQGVTEVYDKISAKTDKLDYLVNNAGFSANWRKMASDLNDPKELAEQLWSIEDCDFANMTAIHTAGPYFMAVKFLPLFQKSENPAITNITSLAAHFLNRAVCEFSYAQSKAAETHLTRLMAAGLLPYKVRVNAVCPGLYRSQLTTGSTDPDAPFWPPQINAMNNGGIPAGREGKWEEIAGAVLMLASPAGQYFNQAERETHSSDNAFRSLADDHLRAVVIDGGWRMCTSALDVK
ncbi:hypothetical protein I350_07754 [Cryptococcus amylolentus CBS 6273]|uniref:NAD(P)-binding protein n=1 Tax=Cryptococcus amylolentus CBS 6273 TaxID=1296118 RepID=A0A1E3JB92_9TREE|nr:hypothetical protein I350_07754 [Cryptococcus amylolentus CBS 6273]